MSYRKQEIFLIQQLDELYREAQRKSSNERLLFLSVILQALLDVSTEPSDKDSVKEKNIRRSAYKWFFHSINVSSSSSSEAEDFNTVCDYADVNPSIIRSFALKVLESNDIHHIRRKIGVLLSCKQSIR